MFVLYEMTNHDSQRESQNVRLSLHILEPIEYTYQFLLVMAHLSVRKKSKTHQWCCDNYNTVMQILYQEMVIPTCELDNTHGC